VKSYVESDFEINICHALHWAAQGNQIKIIKYLLKYTELTESAIEYSLGGAITKGHLRVIKYLVKKGVNPKYKNDLTLVNACAFNNLEMVKYFVEKGCDPTCYNYTPLDMALDHNLQKIYLYLLFQLTKKQQYFYFKICYYEHKLLVNEQISAEFFYDNKFIGNKLCLEKNFRKNNFLRAILKPSSLHMQLSLL
jgi:hypothetical protein